MTTTQQPLALPAGPLVQHLQAAHHIVEAVVASHPMLIRADNYVDAHAEHMRRAAVFTADQPWTEELTDRVAAIIQGHRRVRNVRECTACDWRAERPGYASDPAATLRRHESFNRHLAVLIVQALR